MKTILMKEEIIVIKKIINIFAASAAWNRLQYAMN